MHTVVRASLVAQKVKNSHAMWETWVQSLVWEDPLEEGMATHYSLLAWRIPWTEEPGGGYSPWGRKESDTTERLSTAQHTVFSIHLKSQGGHSTDLIICTSPKLFLSMTFFPLVLCSMNCCYSGLSRLPNALPHFSHFLLSAPKSGNFLRAIMSYFRIYLVFCISGATVLHSLISSVSHYIFLR